MLASVEQTYRDRYCIVGAGAAGITAAKNLKTLGIPFDVIEQQDDIGGTWYYGTPHSSAYRSVHLISSKPLTQYTDFAFPAEYPDYPNHAQVLAYLRSYARHFGVYDHITFNTSVEHIQRADDGLWDITLSANGNHEIRRYAGVIIANGHDWDPRHPDIPGTFNGVKLHSKDYKTPDILQGKRVLVIGAGNSGCDIAVEAAQNAERVYHSTRRGYYYIPKYFFGIPADQLAEPSVRLRIPLALRRLTTRMLLRIVAGDQQRFGLPKPDHKLFESHPTVNSQLLYYLGHGDIIPKPDVQELCGDHVLFKDGSLEPIDLLVYATGYHLSFPFIDGSYLNVQNGNPRLYMHAFHPTYDNLFVVGLLQPDSGIFWLMDYQSQLIAHVIDAQKHSPAKAEKFRRAKTKVSVYPTGRHYLDTPRHYLEIDHFWYSNQVKKHLRQLK
jgi:cation diffusion facilitator CzcD-associated flavoprotein CzcO